MKININNTPFQPYWPLLIDDVDGPYKSIRSARESIQQNFTFLLQTIPGEWPMNPDLGVGLQRYLFENYNSSDLDSAKQNLKNQLSKYLPSVRLVDAKFIQTDEDQDGSSVIFRITYYVELLGITEEIDFGLDSGKKSFFPILHRRDKLGRVL